jgi:hypothetical protein
VPAANQKFESVQKYIINRHAAHLTSASEGAVTDKDLEL